MRGPALEIGRGGLVAVSTIDEHEAERPRPPRRDLGRVPDDGHDGVLESGLDDRAFEGRERVDLPRPGIDEARVVELLARLMLLRAGVMIYREEDGHSFFGRRSQVYRRLPAVAPYLHHGADPGSLEPGFVEGQPLLFRHETDRLSGRLSQLFVHGASLVTASVA